MAANAGAELVFAEVDTDRLHSLVVILSARGIKPEALAHGEHAGDIEHGALCVGRQVCVASGDLHAEIVDQVRSGHPDPTRG